MEWLCAFWRSSVGKKIIMAVTGAALFLFVLGHLAGNLQVFVGPEALDHYAELLHSKPALMWAARIGLLACVGLHILMATQLAMLAREARPVGYLSQAAIQSSYAARTMRFGGLIILLYVIYHVLHLTLGKMHPEFVEHRVYHNVVSGFRQPLVAGVYMVAMLALGLHLYHGLWSATQTLGLVHPKYDRLRKRGSAVIAGLITAGYLSIPFAALTGLLADDKGAAQPATPGAAAPADEPRDDGGAAEETPAEEAEEGEGGQS